MNPAASRVGKLVQISVRGFPIDRAMARATFSGRCTKNFDMSWIEYCCSAPGSMRSRTTSKNSVAVVTGCTLDTMMPWPSSS